MWPFTKRTQAELVYPLEFLSFLRRTEIYSYAGSPSKSLADFVVEKFDLKYDIDIIKPPAWFSYIFDKLKPPYYLCTDIQALDREKSIYDWDMKEFYPGYQVTFSKKSWG